MNKRQAKKAYKKKYGHNPPANDTVYQKFNIDMLKVGNAMKEVFQRFAEVVIKAGKELADGWNKAIENIRSMSEEEYEEFLAKLTPEQRGCMKSIRKGRSTK